MTTTHITLTETIENDLNAFFEFQLNEEANYLAAFTQKDPSDKQAYIEKYTRNLHDPTTFTRTIRVNGEIVGSIAKYIMHGDAGIGYWIDRKWWGQGIATIAVQQFLKLEKTRPLYAYVAFDNYGSQKVLEKCGFVRTGTDKGYANARQAEIEEYIYQLI